MLISALFMSCVSFFQIAVFSRHPFDMWEFNIYLAKTRGGNDIFNQWQKLNAGADIQSFDDYVKIYAFFRKAQAAFGVRKFNPFTPKI